MAEFYLGHRISFDLDIFTTQESLIRPFSLQMEYHLQEEGLKVRITRRFTTLVETIVTAGDEDVRLDLALDTPFRFASPLPTVYGVFVNDFEDLKAEKTLAYYGRAEMRDAVDLHFLLKSFPLKTLIDLASQKDTGFDLYWFAVSLQKAESFPDELERWPVQMIKPFNPKELKESFLSLSQQLMDSLAGG